MKKALFFSIGSLLLFSCGINSHNVLQFSKNTKKESSGSAQPIESSNKDAREPELARTVGKNEKSKVSDFTSQLSLQSENCDILTFVDGRTMEVHFLKVSNQVLFYTECAVTGNTQYVSVDELVSLEKSSGETLIFNSSKVEDDPSPVEMEKSAQKKRPKEKEADDKEVPRKIQPLSVLSAVLAVLTIVTEIVFLSLIAVFVGAFALTLIVVYPKYRNTLNVVLAIAGIVLGLILFAYFIYLIVNGIASLATFSFS